MNLKRVSNEGSLLGFCSSYLTAAPEFGIVSFLLGREVGQARTPHVALVLGSQESQPSRGCFDVPMNCS